MKDTTEKFADVPPARSPRVRSGSDVEDQPTLRSKAGATAGDRGQAQTQAQAQAKIDDPFNTLVISDLHLGEDLGAAATLATRLHVSTVEGQLIQFLRHYARRREDGRPWRLVINGDFIDFLSITIPPDHPELGDQDSRPTIDERLHGLHRCPRTAVAVVAMIAERHAEVWRQMARFLARGNRIEIVCGNHDAELTFPETQAALRSCIARAWNGLPEAGRVGAPIGADVVRDLRFHPWFFYQPGSLWIEHGHQYDENCSFEHQLDPCRPGTDVLAMNVDVASARYVSNRIAEADCYAHESWSFLGYLRFGAGLGPRGFARLFRAYLRFGGAMIGAWRHARATRSRRLEQRAAHRAKLRELAAQCRVDEAALSAIDGYRRPPVVGHLSRLASVLMLDKLVLTLASLAGIVLSLALVTAPLSLAICAVILLAAFAMGRRLARIRDVDNIAHLEAAGERIASRIQARFVVFGHTHEPVARAIGGDGAAYFNTGTWVPSGRPGLLRSFTHLVVRMRGEVPTAQLCQWRDGMSRAFTTTWQAVNGVRSRALAPTSAVAGTVMGVVKAGAKRPLWLGVGVGGAPGGEATVSVPAGAAAQGAAGTGRDGSA